MVSFTLAQSRFPEGASVGAYALTVWPGGVVRPDAAPPGSASESRTITNGAATFTTLTPGTEYVAYAQVNGQPVYMRFRTPPDVDADLRELIERGKTFQPEQYGAIGDGKHLTDAAITNGTATLTSASAPFKPADVGKSVCVDGAGAAGDGLFTSITGYTSATTVTLNANAGATVSGAHAYFHSLDTDAMQACIDAALAAAATAPAVILLDNAKSYGCSKALRHDRNGNCVLSLDANNAFAHLAFIGWDHAAGAPGKSELVTNRVGDTYASGPSTTLAAQLVSGNTTSIAVTDASAWPSSGTFVCENEIIQYASKTGNTLNTLTRGYAPATHANGSAVQITYGPPSFIGSRTNEQGWIGSPQYTGTVTFEGVTIKTPANPTITALDLRSVGGFALKQTEITAGNGSPAAVPIHPHAAGLITPGSYAFGIMASEHVSIAGFYVDFVPYKNDHLKFDSTFLYYAKLAIGFYQGPGGTPAVGSHPVAGNYVTAAYVKTVMGGWDPLVGMADLVNPHHITGLQLDIEGPGGTFSLDGIFQDANNQIFAGQLGVYEWTGVGPKKLLPMGSGGQMARMVNPVDGISDIASAGTITIPPYREIWRVTGTTTITAINPSYAGRLVVLRFSSTAQVTDGSGLKLSGDFAGGANRALGLVYDDNLAAWVEVFRSDPDNETEWMDWTPTLTGWSADPTTTSYRYRRSGKLVTLLICQGTNGTSNATTKTISLPVAAATKANAVWNALCVASDNGSILTAPSLAIIASAATAVSFGKAVNNTLGGSWTASLGCRIIYCMISYEAA